MFIFNPFQLSGIGNNSTSLPIIPLPTALTATDSLYLQDNDGTLTQVGDIPHYLDTTDYNVYLEIDEQTNPSMTLKVGSYNGSPINVNVDSGGVWLSASGYTGTKTTLNQSTSSSYTALWVKLTDSGCQLWVNDTLENDATTVNNTLVNSRASVEMVSLSNVLTRYIEIQEVETDAYVPTSGIWVTDETFTPTQDNFTVYMDVLINVADLRDKIFMGARALNGNAYELQIVDGSTFVNARLTDDVLSNNVITTSSSDYPLAELSGGVITNDFGGRTLKIVFRNNRISMFVDGFIDSTDDTEGQDISASTENFKHQGVSSDVTYSNCKITYP